MNYTEKRKYGLFDYIRFGFSFQPFYAAFFVVHGIIQVLVPVLGIFVTADFVDVAIAALQGTKPKSAVIWNLVALLGLKLYDYASSYLKGSQYPISSDCGAENPDGSGQKKSQSGI